jgi:outer membrane protein assembly factor BamB
MIHLGSISWWQLTSNGEIHLSPIVTIDKIFWANNLGEIYCVNKLTGKPMWKTQLSARDPYRFVKIRNTLLILLPQGELVALSSKNGDVLWKFSTHNQMKISGYVLRSNNTLFIHTAGADVYAIDVVTGKIRWNFSVDDDNMINRTDSTDRTELYGKAELYKNNLIYVDLRGFVHAINTNSGQSLWKTHIGEPVTAIQLQNNILYLGKKNGHLIGLRFNDGELFYSSSVNAQHILCFRDISLSQGWTSFPSLHSIRHALDYPLLVTTTQGRLMTFSKDLSRFDLIYDFNSKLAGCPEISHNSGLVFKASGSFVMIEIHKEAISAFVDGNYPYILEPRLLRPQSDKRLLNFFSPWFPASILINDKDGGIQLLDGKRGTSSWQYLSHGEVISRPFVDGNKLYFADTDGRVSRINLSDGKIPAKIGNRLSVSETKKEVADNTIVEFLVFFDESKFPNPWSQIKLKSDFVHVDTQRSISVDGFYYDMNQWMIRFNPPLQGEWKRTISLIFPDGTTLIDSDTFISTTDTSKSFIKIDPRYPAQFTLDGVHQFFPVGIQDAIRDRNANGDLLDDWAIEQISTNSSRVVDLSTYINTYGQNGAGFNLFRFGVSNASFSLFDRLYVGAQPSIQNSKALDRLFENLRGDSIHIWMSLFSFYINEQPHTIERKFLDEYVRYVIARYGAYVDIWEIGNETHSTDELVSYYADLIRSLDSQKRPITTNWEKPDHNLIEIVSLHKYSSDPSWRADINLTQFVGNSSGVNKPVVISEIGNRDKSWDVDSLNRMRVKLWSGLFNNISLIFWNYSLSRDYYNPITKNGNIYIGEEERQQIAIFSKFANSLPLDTKREFITIPDPKVRGYGIRANEVYLGYIVCESPRQKLGFINPSGRMGTIEWINPKTGTVIEKGRILSTSIIEAPQCLLDLVMKISY